MNCFRYKLDHDYGFAPNPFHGTLSLATCKSQLRMNKNVKVGDWVVGLGSRSMNNLHHVIFAMRVEEIITFDQYWEDPRFECKRAVINGSLVQMYGDNVYHTDKNTGRVVQEYCAHSKTGGRTNGKHWRRDVNGKNVLLSKTFYYFGDCCPEIPVDLVYIDNDSRAIKYKDLAGEDAKIRAFTDWLETTYGQGIHGDPCNWKEFNLPKLDIYEEV